MFYILQTNINEVHYQIKHKDEDGGSMAPKNAGILPHHYVVS